MQMSGSHNDLVCIDDFEQYAKSVLPKLYWQYYSGGSSAQISLRESKNAFKRLRLRPRVLRDVSNIDMSTTILGDKIDFPICIAPTALQKLAHPDGEIATAKASHRAGTCMVLSTWATSTIEEVAESCPGGLRWFHVYLLANKDDNLNCICRAEKEGYKALVITVDAPYRPRKTKEAMKLPPHITFANMTSYLEILKNPESATPEERTGTNPRNTWDMVSWLRSVTKLPIILKGIVTAEDAKLAVQHGVDGIIVSIHGGRELDTVSAPIQVLSEIITAVDNNCEVFFDGGIRHGTDVFKALALGARAVFVGRPVLWGLTYQGEEGVYKILQILKEEFRLAMALMGCASLKDISREMVVHQSHYSKI